MGPETAGRGTGELSENENAGRDDFPQVKGKGMQDHKAEADPFKYYFKFLIYYL